MKKPPGVVRQTQKRNSIEAMSFKSSGASKKRSLPMTSPLDTGAVTAGALQQRDSAARTWQPQDALAAYDAALALDASYYEASCNRGNVLHELGHLGDALAAFTYALKIRPGFVLALTNRANILLQLAVPKRLSCPATRSCSVIRNIRRASASWRSVK